MIVINEGLLATISPRIPSRTAKSHQSREVTLGNLDRAVSLIQRRRDARDNRQRAMRLRDVRAISCRERASFSLSLFVECLSEIRLTRSETRNEHLCSGMCGGFIKSGRRSTGVGRVDAVVASNISAFSDSKNAGHKHSAHCCVQVQRAVQLCSALEPLNPIRLATSARCSRTRGTA